MYLGEYEGYVFPENQLIKHKSTYCHDYYYGLHHEEVYAWSDDDNLTEYSIAGLVFAESFTDEGDVLHVYDEFLETPAAIQIKLDEGEQAMKRILQGDNPCEVCDSKSSCHRLYSCPKEGYQNFNWSR